ncbi:MAG: DUF3109 family protein [Bacteroidota bacterium]
MLVVGKCLVSDDVVQRKFFCDLSHCKGACCIEGDAGAPLEPDEVGLLEDEIEKIFPYMTADGVQVVKESGCFDYDLSGMFVTALIKDKDCVFLIYENGIARCAIEKAWMEKKIRFQKPVSCHLYPIRITRMEEYDAVNYHNWHICAGAIKKGEKENLKVYQFLKEPLIRKYGRRWYKELLKAVEK